jgi:predicted transcriptional regulator
LKATWNGCAKIGWIAKMTKTTILARLEALGLTKTALANHMGIARQNIARLIGPDMQASLPTLRKLAAALGGKLKISGNGWSIDI